jgi:hypothetical protein
MKKAFILSILFLITNTLVHGQIKFDQELNRAFKVTFPDTPKVVTLNRGTLYTAYRVMKEHNTFAAIISKIDTTETAMKTESEISSLYKGIVAGASKDTVNLKVDYDKEVLIDGHKSIEYKIVNYKNPQRIIYMYQRAIYIKEYIYIFSFATDEDNDHNKLMGFDFLNSASLIKY